MTATPTSEVDERQPQKSGTCFKSLSSKTVIKEGESFPLLDDAEDIAVF